MNSYLETSHLFTPYTFEHYMVLVGFLLLVAGLFYWLKPKSDIYQQKVMLIIAVVLAFLQLLKIPLNLYTDTFDVTKDIPLHMCNFLPFVMIWVYASKSRLIWATSFFWVILGVSQANLTPSVEFSLFHYDAIRYWTVHLGLVLLALYPAVQWKWTLELKDVARTFLALNGIAIIIYGLNLLLNSNYLYVMGKPPGTTFFTLLPDWPYYILVLEVIIIVWSLMLWGIFRMIRRNPVPIKQAIE